MHPDVAEYGLNPVSLIVVGGLMIALSAIALSLRVYVRGLLIRSFGWDDRFLVVAFIFYVADCMTIMWIGASQMDQGVAAVPAIMKQAKLSIAGITIWHTSEIFIKLSAAIFFLRIVQEQWQRRTIIISIFVYICFEIAVIFLTLFQCGTLANLLNHKDCLSWHGVMGPISYVDGVFNAATDWVFVLTTLSLVWTTRMPPRAKISVCCLLSLAALGSVVSIVRIPFIRGGRLKLDQAAKVPRVAMLTAVEAGLGIISLSLATLRPLFRTWLDAITSRNGKTRSSSHDIERQIPPRPSQRLRQERPKYTRRTGSSTLDVEVIDIELTRPGLGKRADSYDPVIATISMPSEISGHYGVLDSVYSAEGDKR